MHGNDAASQFHHFFFYRYIHFILLILELFFFYPEWGIIWWRPCVTSSHSGSFHFSSTHQTLSIKVHIGEDVLTLFQDPAATQWTTLSIWKKMRLRLQNWSCCHSLRCCSIVKLSHTAHGHLTTSTTKTSIQSF